MMTSNINSNNSPIWLQAISVNKALLELSIEKLEDEILAFEDAINYAMLHPEKESAIPFSSIEAKISKLNELEAKLANLG